MMQGQTGDPQGGQQGQAAQGNPLEVLQRAVARAVWDNDALREQIKKDPKGAIERNFGVKFPEGLNIKAIDATDANTTYFILPVNPSAVYGFELTDDQLDKVAGGFGFTALAAGVGTAIGIGTAVLPYVPGALKFGAELATQIGGRGSGTAAKYLTKGSEFIGGFVQQPGASGGATQQ